MVKCFEPSCRVDPNTGAMTIYMKNSTCTIVPGDQVGITDTPAGFIITINGEPTLIPRVDPDEVSILETPENWSITVNGETISIPKDRGNDHRLVEVRVGATPTTLEFVVDDPSNDDPPHVLSIQLRAQDVWFDDDEWGLGDADTVQEALEKLAEAIAAIDVPEATVDTYVTAFRRNGTTLTIEQNDRPNLSVSLPAPPSGGLMDVATDNTIEGDGTDASPLHTDAGLVPYNDAEWFLPEPAPTVQIALDQLSAFLSTAFGEDVVILNNPTFYIRQAGGSAAPPIEGQDDLTEANAFDSFASMYTFIERTYIIGDVIVDARGTFDAKSRSVRLDPALFKNAKNITLRGDPANVDALTILCGNRTTDSGKSNVEGIVVSNDANAKVMDVNLQMRNGDTNGWGQSFIQVSGGSTLVPRGNIKFSGNFDETVPGTAGVSMIMVGNNSKVSMVINGTQGLGASDVLHLILAMDPGSSIDNMFMAQTYSSIDVSAIYVDVETSFSVKRMINLDASSSVILGSNPYTDERMTFTGTGTISMGANPLIQERAFSDMRFQFRSGAPDGLPAAPLDWLEASPFDTTGDLVNMDKYSLFAGTYGIDHTDARITVV